MKLARVLVSVGAAIPLLLGTLHLVYTFSGSKLRPRDPDLESRMESVVPGITNQTTMWKLWIGFNTTHSLGLLLFGCAYAYLALAQPDLLFRSPVLFLVGGLFLAGYLIVARVYLFRIPFLALLVAVACYGAGFIAAWIGRTR